ncbi:MAG: hypothetical protein ABJA35_04680 [Parafilimonas sp.]
MKNDLNKAIEQLEKHIRYLKNDFNALLNRSNTTTDICNVIKQIKHAEESLRLKRRMYYAFAD